MSSDMQGIRPMRRAGGILAAAGGSTAVFGSILDWASISVRRGRGPASLVANGTDLFAPFTVLAGLVAVICGLLVAAGRSARLRAGLSAVVLAGGLVVAGLALYVALDDGLVVEALADERGAPRVGRRATVGLEPGLFVVLAGGVLAAAGGVAGLIAARDRASTARAAANVLDAPPEPGDNTPTLREGETT